MPPLPPTAWSENTLTPFSSVVSGCGRLQGKNRLTRCRSVSILIVGTKAFIAITWIGFMASTAGNAASLSDYLGVWNSPGKDCHGSMPIGRLIDLTVTPESRRKDIVNHLTTPL